MSNDGAGRVGRSRGAQRNLINQRAVAAGCQVELVLRRVRLTAGFGGAPSNFGLIDSLDNAQVPIHCIAQHPECFLVPGTVVCGDRLRDAVEFN